jgi:hypothetical protein
VQILRIDVHPITRYDARQRERRGLGHRWRSLANIHVAPSDLIESKRSIIILCLYSLK